MKLKITKFEGTIEAEIVDGSLNIDDIRRLLIKEADREKESSTSKDKLTRYTEKMPI